MKGSTSVWLRVKLEQLRGPLLSRFRVSSVFIITLIVMGYEINNTLVTCTTHTSWLSKFLISSNSFSIFLSFDASFNFSVSSLIFSFSSSFRENIIIRSLGLSWLYTDYFCKLTTKNQNSTTISSFFSLRLSQWRLL